ncbi:hypothetical protein BXU06_17020 [Aquaspirillum sp. LM1]|uniref:hypothetical protein n=1 Tax=Aquaspirillum sp. LM1 TaxID=1938604 RepID=UPI000983B395|nr:hypothetical protein [Aquaspirillum sp. LM1]AQR66565.1 hypothetical protein BXU06_17020 [Aquaspirillum sp. LM1]
MGHKSNTYASTSSLSSSTSGQENGYRIALSNGSLSAIYKVEHGRSTLKRADSDESWALNGNQLVKTEQEHGVTQTTVYTDSDGNGIYTRQSQSSTSSHDGSSLTVSTSQEGYRFDISNGSVLAVYEIEHGRSQLKRIDADEIWVVSNGQVSKIEQEHGATHTTVYTDSDGDGIYQAVRNGSDDGAIRLSGVNDDTGWPG